MDVNELKVLLVEDSPADARLIRETLVEDGVHDLDIEHVQLVNHALERLAKGGIDVVLLDLLLPDNMGPDTVQKVIAAAPDVPVVVLSGVADKQAAMESVRHGAQDYLVKGQITGEALSRTIHHAVERKRFENEIARQAERGAFHERTSVTREPLRRPPPGDALHKLREGLDQAGEADLAAGLRDVGIPDRRVRGLTRVLEAYLRLAEHEPHMTRCDTARAFDDALVRLQDRILEDALHVRRYPLQPAYADEALLSRLFETMLAGVLAATGEKALTAQLASETEGDRLHLTLAAAPTERRHAGPDHDQRSTARPIDIDHYPELVLARRVAARLNGEISAERDPRTGAVTLHLGLPAALDEGSPREARDRRGQMS